MAVAAPELPPYRFSRAEYYAIAGSLDPTLRYELLNGTIYAMRPAKPPTERNLREKMIPPPAHGVRIQR